MAVLNGTRGVDFTLTVTAKDILGNTKTGENGTPSLALTSTDGSDALDDNGTAIASVGLSSGTWSSTTIAISGGTQSDVCSITSALSGYAAGTSDTITMVD